MGTKVTDSVQPLVSESHSYRALTETLQVLLATRPVLAVVMVVGEAPDGASTEAQRIVTSTMDDVEQFLLACFRRSDRVMRCGEASCAAILLDAEIDGALCAVQRFQRLLSSWPPLAVALRVGIAAAPEQTCEGQALLKLALQPYVRIPSARAGEPAPLPRMDEITQGKQTVVPSPSKSHAAQRKAGKGIAQDLSQVLVMSTSTALSAEPVQQVAHGGGTMPPAETLTKARARALGIPYIAPPQRIPSRVRNLVPTEVMRQLRCLPIGRDRNALTVALADPTDQGVLQRLEQLTGLTIFPVMTDPDALEALAQPMRPRRTSQVASSQS